MKKVFLEISQNSQENTYARVSFLTNLQASGRAIMKEVSIFTIQVCAAIIGTVKTSTFVFLLLYKAKGYKTFKH